MALVARISWPFKNHTRLITIITSHKLSAGLRELEKLTQDEVIMGGDQQCPGALPKVNKGVRSTVPVMEDCTFHATRKHQGDNICSNMLTANFSVTMPCSASVPLLSDHAIISVDVKF